MRGVAFAMGAQVRHDHPEAGIRQQLSVTEFDPVGFGVREQAVEQDQRTAFSRFMDLEIYSVKG